MKPSSAFAISCGIAAIIIPLSFWRAPRARGKEVKRLQMSALICAAAAILWPGIIVYVAGWESLCKPVAALTVVFTLGVLCVDVKAASTYEGPLTDYESYRILQERGIQVSACAFAVSTLLLSLKDKEILHIVTIPVFMALVLCIASAVPSNTTNMHMSESGAWNATQKAFVTYSAALLCVAVALCAEHLAARRK